MVRMALVGFGATLFSLLVLATLHSGRSKLRRTRMIRTAEGVSLPQSTGIEDQHIVSPAVDQRTATDPSGR